MGISRRNDQDRYGRGRTARFRKTIRHPTSGWSVRRTRGGRAIRSPVTLGHMQRALSFVAILPVTLLMGCAYALPVASRQTDVKLRVQTSHPEHHAVRVAAIEPPSDYRVPSDGRVAFTVPSFRHGCSVYLFGAIKIADGTPEHLRVIEVRRDERVLRRFSLTQLTSLPEDETGYRIVRVGD